MWQDIKNIYHLVMAISANIYYGFPSQRLVVIGVTGTDGKTTTVSLIYHILNKSHRTASMVSSTGAIINGKNYDVGFHVTTPSPFAIQRFLSLCHAELARPERGRRVSGSKSSESKMPKRVRHDKKPFLVLEVTSHALDQYRVFGIKFDVGVLTNVTHEHLDYHKTYENYVATKVRLLEMSKTAVVNRDDESYGMINDKGLMIKDKIKWITYGMGRNADVTLKGFPFKTNLIGEFNKYNILAAISACKALGISDEDIRHGLESFNPPKGREDIVYDKDFKIMIDFAHTPNAFEQILSSVRPSIKGRLIHVFGSAGQRDASKRPLMGKISSKYADLIILTAEDPRKEAIEKIMDDIALGIKNSKFKIQNYNVKLRGNNVALCNSKFKIKDGIKFALKIPDRQEAIKTAIEMARKGDFVIVTGKSHEKSMNYGHGELPWDEYKVVEEGLRMKG